MTLLQYEINLKKEAQYDEEILRLLSELGLSENESMVYKYLVEKGGASTKELLRDLSLRQPQVYDIMSALSRKNFVSIQESRPKKYIPANLELIMERRMNSLLEGKQKLLKWFTSSRQKSSEPSMWMDRNWDGFINNARDIILNSTSDVCIESTHEIFTLLRSGLMDLKRKGVKVLLLVFGEKLEEYKKSGLEEDRMYCTEIRYHDPGQFFAVIADGRAAAFMPRTGAFRSEEERHGYIFKDNDVAWFLSHNFFYAWYRATPVYSEPVTVPCVYASHRIAVSDMLRLWKNGRKLTVRVRGITTAGGKEIEVKGTVTKINTDHDVVNFTLVSDGKELTVGGYDTIVEDVEARSIEILES
jgi:sugar-specific transcriptional regulator TrmB